jgi:hypothetical protein
VLGSGLRFPVSEGGEWVAFRRTPYGGIVPVDDEPRTVDTAVLEEAPEP